MTLVSKSDRIRWVHASSQADKGRGHAELDRCFSLRSSNGMFQWLH